MKRDVRLLVVLLVVVGCSLGFLTFWKVTSSQDRTLDEANVHALNLAQALSTYSDGLVRQSSSILLGLVERLESEGVGSHQLQRLRLLVRGQQSFMPQLSGIAIYDSYGNLLLSSNGPSPTGLNCGDRAFFIHHRDSSSVEPFIGPSIKSRANNEWVVTISRRFNDYNGDFAGVVAVTLDVKNFLRLFGKIDVGKDGAIGLTSADGSLLVRYPFREKDMGRNFSKSPIFAKYLTDSAVGTASFVSSLDGVNRLYGFIKSENTPLVTTVAMGRDEALAVWRIEALILLVVVSVIVIVTGFIIKILIEGVRRRQSVEIQLRLMQKQLLKANSELEDLARTDALTGLANRRCFEEALAVEVGRAQRSGESLALLVIDVDYFKSFNDTYGHLEGDKCLREVGQALSECVRRPSDLAARYGGEEFGVLMPNTSMEGAAVVAQSILDRLSGIGINHQLSPYGYVTVSIGGASMLGAEVVDGKMLIDVADKALYRAKSSGRNRIDITGFVNSGRSQ